MKRIVDIVFTLVIIIFFLPLSIFIALFIKLHSTGPVIFKQKRVGKNGKIFTLYKFRTMVQGAERMKGKYISLNEADGPVFKVRNDPRLTKFGKMLRVSGLDELPQFYNVLKGDMSIVGPRPFPVDEAARLSKTQKEREKVLPGITSTWVVEGNHKIPFAVWMRMDKDYVENAGLKTDFVIMVKTARLILKNVVIMIVRALKK